MAFHVSCPITCRKICFCAMGFTGKLRTEEGRKEFMQEVARIEQFLDDPWLIKSTENATVQVLVPKVVVTSAPLPLTPIPPPLSEGTGVGGEGVATKPAASSQTKRIVLQKQAAAASVVAEDFVKKFESGDLVTSVRDADGDEQGQSNTKVMCRICFSGENEGGERVRKMLSCGACLKKYHRNCLKRWSQNRDLFHWSSWACPSCRICEVCHKTGDPSKFMFCKRCDSATHCYCQQPLHKNVGHGPYLCPKHTKCHSCASSVPGNGLSVRWFLGYTCCDACGRLFVKGNYCPVCLKVYRDSEATPMVCCDICQRWVHCPCDQISDAKYLEFQSDGNLQYVCPTCRGECCQFRNLEEAAQELWRRIDETDKDLRASLRAAAGLPTQEEIFDISPFSDDEDSVSVSKAEVGRSLKLSLKGLSDKSPRKSKEHGKKSLNKTYAKKKGSGASLISGNDSTPFFAAQSDGPFGYITGDSGEPAAFSPATGSLTDGMVGAQEATVSIYKNIDEVAAKTSRTIKIKSNKSAMEDAGTNSGTPNTTQGRKLVIHLGGRNRNATSPVRSESSNVKMGQDFTSSSGIQKEHDDQVKGSNLRGQEGHVIKLKKANQEPSNISSKLSGDLADGSGPASQKKSYSVVGTRALEDGLSARGGSEVLVSKRSRSSLKYAGDVSVSGDMINESSSLPSLSQALTKDRKPSLKFKIPKKSTDRKQNITSNLNAGTKELLSLSGKDELIYTRGQRSKRKRPALADEDSHLRGEDSRMNDFADANWVLQKLGKDAAGKRVEVHQPSNDSWRRGTVVKVVDDLSSVSVALDDGNSKSFELGKQGIRFVSQKQKH